jgi:transcriptional regulator of arginine metabolism
MVRTGTGQAQLLGVLLDTSDAPSVTGTIAGDDTVLVVTKGRPEQRAALALLSGWFGEDKHDAV